MPFDISAEEFQRAGSVRPLCREAAARERVEPQTTRTAVGGADSRLQRLQVLVLRVEAGCARADAEAEASGRRAALEQLAQELVGRHVTGLGENGSRAG